MRHGRRPLLPKAWCGTGSWGIAKASRCVWRARLGRLEAWASRWAQLFGAAEGLRAVIGIVVSGLPIERAAYEESVASVRAQLDQQTFAAAWAEGRAMTLEQAIALALDEEN